MAQGGASDVTAAQKATYFATAAVISLASPVTDIKRCNGTVNFQFGGTAYVPVNTTHVTANAFTPFVEPLVLFTGTTASTANSISYQINLSAFKDTILEFKLQSSLKY